MGRKKEPIFTYEMSLIPTDIEYPCLTCHHLASDGECPQGKTCGRWQEWFGEAWKTIRISYGKTEDAT